MADSNRPRDGSPRPWVRGGGKRINALRDLGRADDETTASDDAPQTGGRRPAGSAWSHYVQRARNAMEAGPRDDDDEALDTIEIEIKDIEDEPPSPARARTARPPSSPWGDDEGRLAGERRVFADEAPPPRPPEPPRPTFRGGSGEPPRRPPEPPRMARPGRPTANEYPDWFSTQGLEDLLSGDLNAASRYYKRCLKRASDDPEGWYGTAAVLLARARLADGASTLVKAWKIDDGFPVARLVRDLCPEAPEAWYEFAGALVALRRKPAYECADLVLAAVVASERCPIALRQRASKVRQNIASALEARAVTDRRRSAARPRPSLRRALMQSVTIVVLIVVIGGAALLLRAPRRSAPPPEVPLASVAGAAPADTSSAEPTPTPHATPSPTPAPAAAPSSSVESGAPSTSPSVAASAAAPSGTPLAASSATPQAAGSATPQAASSAAPQAAGSATPQAAPTVTPQASATPQAAPTATPQASATPQPAPSASAPSSGMWPSAASPSPTPGVPADATLYISDDRGNGHPVKVNGEPVGKTPVTMLVQPGRVYTVMVSLAPGKTVWKARIKPPAGQTQRIEAVLSDP